MTNTYSQKWFELFSDTQQFTELEAAFLTRHLPNPPFKRVLDLPCGGGRHANALAKRGYEVVGVDVDREALAVAERAAEGSVKYVEMDMRHVGSLETDFGAVLSLWQSFGYFDEATNRDVLEGMSARLRPKGRLILDIYHREFFEAHEGVQVLERLGTTIHATNTVKGNRLTAHLEYEGGGSDTFDWQLYTPDEITALAALCGLRLLLACTWFDEAEPPSPEVPRVQYVFEKA